MALADIKYFILDASNNQYGPYDLEQLKKFVTESRLLPDTLLKVDATGESFPARQIKGIFPAEMLKAPDVAQPPTMGAQPNRLGAHTAQDYLYQPSAYSRNYSSDISPTPLDQRYGMILLLLGFLRMCVGCMNLYTSAAFDKMADSPEMKKLNDDMQKAMSAPPPGTKGALHPGASPTASNPPLTKAQTDTLNSLFSTEGMHKMANLIHIFAIIGLVFGGVAMIVGFGFLSGKKWGYIAGITYGVLALATMITDNILTGFPTNPFSIGILFIFGIAIPIYVIVYSFLRLTARVGPPPL